MPNKLSNSKLSIYQDCPYKYKLNYIDKIRPTTTSSALIFGLAIDKALNELLLNRNLDNAVMTLLDSLKGGLINNVPTDYRTSTLVRYSKKDFDEEILTADDCTYYNSKFSLDLLSDYEYLNNIKYYELTEEEKSRYSVCNWLSLYRKGIIMLKSYEKKVLPRIVKVIAVQEPISLKNQEDDELVGFLDIIVTLDDGKTYLLDHKTASKAYEEDSAGKSQQLLIYHHECKEKYGIDGVGYIVLLKDINKNKKRYCKHCKFDGSKTKHKTCPQESYSDNGGYEKCSSKEWDIQVNPDCDIDIIINQVTDAEEDIVIEKFDTANQSIKAGCFEPNYDSCFKYGKCDYYAHCHKGISDGLIDMSKEKK